MTEFEALELVIEDNGQVIQAGNGTLMFRGEPWTVPTVGTWRVEVGDDALTSITVTVPVRIRVEPKA